MPFFKYVVLDSTGQKVNGMMEAKDRASITDSLRKSQFIIVSVKELKGKGLIKKKGNIKLDDLVVFTRQLSALVKASIPLLKSLNILFAQVENRYLREVISSIMAKIESGSSLSSAMAGYPEVFSLLYINMIKAGEFSGALDGILERLAIYLENSNKLTRKVKSAFVYPVVVVSVALLITAIMFLKVIPGFKDIFSSLGAKLPLPTLVMIKTSELFQKYFLLIVGFIIIMVFILRRLMKIPRFQLAKDEFILNFPVFGKLIRKVAIARFTRTLSTLLRSGVVVLSALEISSSTSGNKIIESGLKKVATQVSKGERIGESLAENKVFAPLVVNLIAVGEETGDIPSMLDKIAAFYEDEVDVMVSGLTSLIEPFIIVFLGVFIGGIAVAMFLPILQLSQVIGK
jgi:type IV pilus assembly protein PilC